MCTQCHALSEMEETKSLKVPEHPHLAKLRRRRKELLRRELGRVGERVGGMRLENEMLLALLNDTEGIHVDDDDDDDDDT